MARPRGEHGRRRPSGAELGLAWIAVAVVEEIRALSSLIAATTRVRSSGAPSNPVDRVRSGCGGTGSRHISRSGGPPAGISKVSVRTKPLRSYSARLRSVLDSRRAGTVTVTQLQNRSKWTVPRPDPRRRRASAPAALVVILDRRPGQGILPHHRHHPIDAAHSSRESSRYPGRSMPGCEPLVGLGLTGDKMQAHHPRPDGQLVSASSSIGGPLLTFAEASSRGILRTEVARSSLSVGDRTSAQRPGTSFSTRASSAPRFSPASSTCSPLPKSITER